MTLFTIEPSCYPKLKVLDFRDHPFGLVNIALIEKKKWVAAEVNFN